MLHLGEECSGSENSLCKGPEAGMARVLEDRKVPGKLELRVSREEQPLQ